MQASLLEVWPSELVSAANQAVSGLAAGAGRCMPSLGSQGQVLGGDLGSGKPLHASGEGASKYELVLAHVAVSPIPAYSPYPRSY